MSVSARRTIAAAAVVAVATGAAVGIASTIDSSPGGEPGTSTRSASGPGTTPPSGDAHAAGTPTPAAPASGASASGAPSGPRSGAPVRETAPDATTPASPRPHGHDDLLEAVPEEITASDGLVTDYPALLGPAPHSRVVSSSLSPSGRRVQVALVARHAGASDAVLRYYRTYLARHGFAERRVDAAGGSAAAGFNREDGTVVVTVDAGRTGAYTLYATLVVG